MSRCSPFVIVLSDADRRVLEGRARAYTLPHAEVVRAKIVLPLQVVPNLIAALQEHVRVFSESAGAPWDKGPVH